MTEASKSAAHTPGPWATDKTVDNRHHIVTLPDGRIAAYCGYIGAHDDAESQANARLIASSPEMLERVRIALDYLTQESGPDAVLAASQLRAAIAKATGRAA